MSNIVQFPMPNDSAVEGLSDALARTQALDTRISCIVEAPAGSGKTGLLMQRYLKLLADPAVTQPEEVLAVTFTNKATAELRERVVKQLEAAERNAPLPENASPFERETREYATAALAHDKQRSWNVLSRPQRLNIRTIDSICASIANSLPVLSGAGGSLRPAQDAAPLHRLAAERTLMQLGGNDRALHEALYTVLLHRDASLKDVESLIASMLSDREQWGELIPLDPEKLTDEYLENHTRLELERTLETIVCRSLSRAAALMPAGTLHAIAGLASDLGLNNGYDGGPNPIAFCTQISGPPEAVAEHLDHWKALITLLLTEGGDFRKPRGVTGRNMKFDIDKAQKARLELLLDALQSDELAQALKEVRSLPPARYPEHQWRVTKALFHVLRRALIELQLVFAEHGTCDFTELSIAARQALASVDEDDMSADLALTPGGQLRHLLVDEMQDTSAAQYELIHRLTHTWDGATQTLFLVGDPKQSIYLFRQARVERFLRTMREQRLGDVPLRALHLTANFRSQAKLVEACNHVFEQLFPSPEEALRTQNNSEVPYIQAIPTRAATETDNIHWHVSILEDEFAKAPKEKHRTLHERQQASQVRAVIEYWLAKPLPPDRSRDTHGQPKPWSIAVLARARHHFGPIVAELKRCGVPFRAVDIDPLTTRQEVLDILSLTRALLHPADRVAWLAILRAPWCGLSLADLLALTGEGATVDACAPIAQLVATRRMHLSHEGQVLLDRSWPVLSSAIASLGSEPFATHVERTWRSLGGDAILQPEERTNVLRYLEVLAEVAAEDSFVDLNRLTTRLQSLYAEPTSQKTSVELLTIHKAKGLEWDVVLVPSLERQTANATSDLLNWIEVDDTGEATASIMLAPIGGKGSGEADPLNDWLRKARNTRELSELTRLFYVLATRAAEELHLFGSAKRSKSGIQIPANSSLLKAVWPVASQLFEELSAPSTLSSDLEHSLSLQDEALAQPELALTASASNSISFVSRIPIAINPATRFLVAAEKRLPYTPAAELQRAPTFVRPEGSFAVRAFGNVVHRYLQLMADALRHKPAEELLTEITTWQDRLHASFRGEGLAPTLAEREATRALEALQKALRDPDGRWVLSPQPSAFTERSIALASQTLRVDRTFIAGPAPLSTGETHTWIVDFKTSTARGLSESAFEAEERAKYGPQLAVYAEAARALSANSNPIVLALYYPLIPRLLYWTV